MCPAMNSMMLSTFAQALRQLGLVPMSVALAAIAAGCTSPGGAAASAPSDGKLRGDFGEL